MIQVVSSAACMKGEVFAPDIARLPVADAIELADVSLQLGKDGVDGGLRDGDDLGVGAVVGEFLRVGAYALVPRFFTQMQCVPSSSAAPQDPAPP